MPSMSEAANESRHKNFLLAGTNRNLYLWLCFLLLPSVAGHAQTAVKVALCDLVKETGKYSGQWIEVRGKVSAGFEEFDLRTSECGEELRPVWLVYGGVAATSTASTVNVLQRKTDTAMEVDKTRLERDANFDLFEARVGAQRARTPDGGECLLGCYLYDVTATFMGFFLEAPEGDGNGYGGGCCHLLIIQQVKEVTAVRTQVPAGGRFECSRESFEMDRAQAESAFDRRECAGEADCRNADNERFSVVAEHWHDKQDLYQGTAYPKLWISADHLTKYELFGPGQENGMGHSSRVTAKRTACRPTEAPYPLTTPVRCTELHSDFDVSREHMAEVPQWNGTLEAVSLHALQEAAQRWGISLMPGLQFGKCGSPRVTNGKETLWCTWNEPTAMQAFQIGIARSRPLHRSRRRGEVPWILAGGIGLACVAEKN